MQELPRSFPSCPEFRPGEVWLVGAGPGDPRLLTLMAVHALQTADAIVHDALIDERMLDLRRAGADLHFMGKRGGQPSVKQADINARLIELAKAGRRVLRLKGGDPFIFARGGEEAAALAEAGVSFRVVPGLTSGLAAPALAGIPTTTRETNHAVILATGHLAAEGETGERQWISLARTGQPIVLYMAMANLASIANALMKGGLDPTMPVAIITSASMEGERVLETMLATAAADAKAQAMTSPAIIVIGRNVAYRGLLQPKMVSGA